jgi:hypothetical protein
LRTALFAVGKGQHEAQEPDVVAGGGGSGTEAGQQAVYRRALRSRGAA